MGSRGARATVLRAGASLLGRRRTEATLLREGVLAGRTRDRTAETCAGDQGRSERSEAWRSSLALPAGPWRQGRVEEKAESLRVVGGGLGAGTGTSGRTAPGTRAGSMSEEFAQSKSARLRVIRLRLTSGVLIVSIGLALLFGWLAIVSTSPTLRVVAVAAPTVVIVGVLVLATRGMKAARRAELGRLVLTQGGIHFESHERESLGGSIPWIEGGEVLLADADDWQMRRAGVRTLVVLPPGAPRWVRPGRIGQFGNARLVVSWLTVDDAKRAAAEIEGRWPDNVGAPPPR